MQAMEFDEWITTWFDRDEADRDFWLGEEMPESIPDADALAYSTWLFRDAKFLLAPYSNVQIGNSLWGYINEMGCPLRCVQDSTLPVEERVACIESIYDLFADVIAVRSAEVLGHLSEKGDSLHAVCYMWWDIFPLYGKIFDEEPEAQRLYDAVLQTQAQILDLPHAGCQESALHGLGHWSHYHSRPVERIVDAFLASGKARRPELIAYAKNARRGMVL